MYVVLFLVSAKKQNTYIPLSAIQARNAGITICGKIIHDGGEGLGERPDDKKQSQTSFSACSFLHLIATPPYKPGSPQLLLSS